VYQYKSSRLPQPSTFFYVIRGFVRVYIANYGSFNVFYEGYWTYQWCV